MNVLNKLLGKLDYRFLIKEHFKFLTNYGYKEITDKTLIIEGWRDGIAFTNNKKIIIFLIDNREVRFSTIIYVIQPDFQLPDIDSEDYIVLDFYLQQKKGVNYTRKYTDFGAYGKEKVIKNTSEIVREMAKEIL